jgi:hypothetical protein
MNGWNQERGDPQVARIRSIPWCLMRGPGEGRPACQASPSRATRAQSVKAPPRSAWKNGKGEEVVPRECGAAQMPSEIGDGNGKRSRDNANVDGLLTGC